MSKDNIIPFFINPLVFFKASDFLNGEDTELTADDVLEYLTKDGKTVPISQMKANYQLLYKKSASFFGLPSDFNILNKMIFPLKRSIGYFTIGNFRESIAVAAFVAEMATIFKYQIYSVSVIKRPILSEADEKENLSQVERMTQSARIKKLKLDGLIDATLACKFDFVRLKRNKYLHSLLLEEGDIQIVAKEVIENTVEIVRTVFALRIANGRVTLDQRVIDYLSKKGLVGK